MKKRKGIILAGGLGTRLYPLSLAVSKQLLPIFDKPMIYYPLTVLMFTGIREILIITKPEDKKQFQILLGNGRQWGIRIKYKIQPTPKGLAQAFILSEKFLQGSPSTMILGDNIFFGNGLLNLLQSTSKQNFGATIFGYHVNNPSSYGIINFNNDGNIVSIVEKPKIPKSKYAITGLYFVDGSAPRRARKIKPSKRGELEITTLLNTYLDEGNLNVKTMGRGYAWFDTGTPTSMLDASNYVRTLSERQGLQIGSPDEVAYNLGWINEDDLKKRTMLFSNTTYGDYLRKLLISEF